MLHGTLRFVPLSAGPCLCVCVVLKYITSCEDALTIKLETEVCFVRLWILEPKGIQTIIGAVIKKGYDKEEENRIEIYIYIYIFTFHNFHIRDQRWIYTLLIHKSHTKPI